MVVEEEDDGGECDKGRRLVRRTLANDFSDLNVIRKGEAWMDMVQ